MNTDTAGDQQSPSVLALDDTFVIVWDDSSSGNHDITARVFNNDATPATAETVLVSAAGDQVDPVVVGSPLGGIAVSYDDGGVPTVGLFDGALASVTTTPYPVGATTELELGPNLSSVARVNAAGNIEMELGGVSSFVPDASASGNQSSPVLASINKGK